MKKLTLILILGTILNIGLSAQEYIKYPLKSGSVVYTMTMMGTESAMTTYFTNSGNVQCTDIVMEMFGMKINTRSIIKDKKMYALDMTQKTYTETVLSEDDLKKMSNYMTDESTTTMEGVKKVGEETVIGKPCKIYSIDKDGAVVKFWSWNGLMLKMESTAQGMTISMLATSISESSPDQGMFEIPSDFTKK